MPVTLKNITADGKNIRKFYVNKTYNITQDNASSYGLKIGTGLSGLSGSYIRAESFDLMGPQNSDGTYKFLLFSSMHIKYYTTHSAHTPEYLGQVKIPVSESHQIAVIGISQHTFGEAIKPSTLVLVDNEIGKTIVDDGMGNLKFKYPDSFPGSQMTMSLTIDGVTGVYSTSSIIGNVFYEHGIAIVGNRYYDSNLPSSYTYLGTPYEYWYDGCAGHLFASGTISASVSFKNSVPIYEHEYMCIVPAGELNVSRNPTSYLTKYDKELIRVVTCSILSTASYSSPVSVGISELWSGSYQNSIFSASGLNPGSYPIRGNELYGWTARIAQTATPYLSYPSQCIIYGNTIGSDNSVTSSVDLRNWAIGDILEISLYTIPSSSYTEFTTHSKFTPYITTIGLYNDNGDLVAVSKFSKPIKKIPYLDYTFVVRFDA